MSDLDLSARNKATVEKMWKALSDFDHGRKHSRSEIIDWVILCNEVALLSSSFCAGCHRRLQRCCCP